MGRPMPQFGRSEAAFNVVPVDYVVAAMVAAAGDPATIGQTLHLVDPEPLSAHDLVELLSQTYTGAGTRGRVPAGMVERSLRVKRVREMFEGIPAESIAYLNHPVGFDTRRALAILEPHGLRPPNFGTYVEAMVRFFREHEEDPDLGAG
jgi:hypothetical protein